MRVLPPIQPTPEQLTILADTSPGAVLIRGAAGSGKTTTALYRLQSLRGSRLNRRDRLGLEEPVRVLVLTYNRTLEGYIRRLVEGMVEGHDDLVLEVSTFSKWALGLVGPANPMGRNESRALLRPFLQEVAGDADFLFDEVAYILDRFESENLEAYMEARRDGRGASPRVDRVLRRALLDDVIKPYCEAKTRRSLMDWNDVAVAARKVQGTPRWDVVIVDEAQDFTANQVRTIVSHLNDPYSLTFVTDAAQRIYPRFFTWRETGVDITSTYSLKTNYRNTRAIAEFAVPLVEGLPMQGEGGILNLEACQQDGQKPVVISGKFSQQVDFLIEQIRSSVDLAVESVAFLHPKGGGWFDYLKRRLDEAEVGWVEISGANSWPEGDKQIALSTMHSAKGLEFDHVFIPGLDQQVTRHGEEDGDSALEQLRRLLAMAIARARKTVVVGHSNDSPSSLIGLLKPGTFDTVIL